MSKERGLGNATLLSSAGLSVLVVRQFFVQLVLFGLLFRALESVLLTPLALQFDQWISGRPAIDSTDLVYYVLSPRGFIAFYLAFCITNTIRVFEHAGLTQMLWRGLHGRSDTAVQTLVSLTKIVPKLLYYVSLGLLWVLLIASPLLITAGWFAWRLMPRHDINYYLAEWPPEFTIAVVITSVMAVVTTLFGLWLAVHWRLALAVQICQGSSVRGSFGESFRLVRGRFGHFALGWLLVISVQIAIGIALWGSGECLSWIASKTFVEPSRVQLGWIICLLAVRWLVAILLTMVASFFEVAMFTNLYRNRLRDLGELKNVPAVEPKSVAGEVRQYRQGGWLVIAVFASVVLISILSSYGSIKELLDERPVLLTAHRGVAVNAAENTLGAIRDAIHAGANFVEIDVQLTKDGQIVVMHDSDFSRQAKDARKVWDLDYSQIREIKLTAARPVDPDDERAPLLIEVLQAIKGKISLNIELKYYGDHEPNLAARVVEMVKQEELEDQVVFQSLRYEALQEIRRIDPKLRVGYLFSVNAMHPSRLDIDFLSAQVGRINATLIEDAHSRHREVHVWTVDDESTTERLMDLGADNLITNQPSKLRPVVDSYIQASSADRLLRRLRRWLVD